VQSNIAAAIAAGLAVPRLVRQFPIVKPRLFAGVPQELTTTIGADKPHIRVIHLPPCSPLKDEKTKSAGLIYQVDVRISMSGSLTFMLKPVK
jgi:hypothetical protein